MQMPLGGLFEVSWGCLTGAPGSWRSLGEAPRGPREALEASWRPLGGVLELLKRLGRLKAGFQGLPGALSKGPPGLSRGLPGAGSRASPGVTGRSRPPPGRSQAPPALPGVPGRLRALPGAPRGPPGAPRASRGVSPQACTRRRCPVTRRAPSGVQGRVEDVGSACVFLEQRRDHFRPSLLPAIGAYMGASESSGLSIATTCCHLCCHLIQRRPILCHLAPSQGLAAIRASTSCLR